MVKKAKIKEVIKKRRKKTKILKVLQQTGKRKSVKIDRKRKALLPGRRVSASGRTYTETRRNRSDRKGSKL